MDLGEQGGPLPRQEVAERPEADDEVEGRSEGQGEGVAAHQVRAAPVGRAARREHARADVDPDRPLAAHLRQHTEPRAGPAAQVESALEGPHAA